MPMIVADELEADWARVRVVQAPGDEERYGNQDTDGSRSLRHLHADAPVGAAARPMLEAAAAAQWKVPVARCRPATTRSCTPPPAARSATARSPRPRRSLPCLPWGAQAEDRRSSATSGAASSARRRQDIVTGKAVYGIDTRLPGMHYAVVARPQVYGGTVKSFDATEALKVPGV